MTKQCFAKISFFVTIILFHPVFFQTPSRVTSHPSYCIAFLLSPFLSYKLSAYIVALSKDRFDGIDDARKKNARRFWLGDLDFYFLYWPATTREGAFAFVQGSKRKAERMYSRWGRTLAARPHSPSVKRTGEIKRLLRHAWFRCDIILPPGSTTSLFSNSTAFLALLVLSRPLVAFNALPTLHRCLDNGWTCYRPENARWERREGGARRRETEGGERRAKEIHNGNFFFRGFCGENTVTQWHARKEVRYLKRPGTFLGSFSHSRRLSPRTLLISLARSWHADEAHLSTAYHENTFANHV